MKYANYKSAQSSHNYNAFKASKKRGNMKKNSSSLNKIGYIHECVISVFQKKITAEEAIGLITKKLQDRSGENG